MTIGGIVSVALSRTKLLRVGWVAVNHCLILPTLRVGNPNFQTPIFKNLEIGHWYLRIPVRSTDRVSGLSSPTLIVVISGLCFAHYNDECGGDYSVYPNAIILLS